MRRKEEKGTSQKKKPSKGLRVAASILGAAGLSAAGYTLGKEKDEQAYRGKLAEAMPKAYRKSIDFKGEVQKSRVRKDLLEKSILNRQGAIKRALRKAQELEEAGELDKSLLYKHAATFDKLKNISDEHSLGDIKSDLKWKFHNAARDIRQLKREVDQAKNSKRYRTTGALIGLGAAGTMAAGAYGLRKYRQNKKKKKEAGS